MKKTLLISAIAIAILASLLFGRSTGRAVKSQGNGMKAHTVATGVDFEGTPVIVKTNSGNTKAYVSQKFASLADIDNYVTKRKRALARLVQEDPERQIEVVISPSEKVPLREITTKANNLKLNELGLDLFADGKWNRMVQFDETSHLVDISGDISAIEQRITELETSAAPVKNEQRNESDGRANQAFEFGVRFARGFMPARSAAALQRDERILLVDPVTDMADELQRRFGEVRIVDVPQLFVIREMKLGRGYGTNSR